MYGSRRSVAHCPTFSKSIWTSAERNFSPSPRTTASLMYGRDLEGVLHQGGRDVLAARGDEDGLLAVHDAQVAVGVQLPPRRRCGASRPRASRRWPPGPGSSRGRSSRRASAAPRPRPAGTRARGSARPTVPSRTSPSRCTKEKPVHSVIPYPSRTGMPMAWKKSSTSGEMAAAAEKVSPGPAQPDVVLQRPEHQQVVDERPRALERPQAAPRPAGPRAASGRAPIAPSKSGAPAAARSPGSSPGSTPAASPRCAARPGTPWVRSPAGPPGWSGCSRRS